MDLIPLFEATLNPEANIRKSAEQQLEQASLVNGFIPGLLGLIASPTINQSIKQAMAIYLKNSLKNTYSQCVDTEKQTIQRSLLDLMASCNNELRRQIVACIAVILSRDEGKSWPQFVQDAISRVKTGDLNQILAGSLSLLELVKIYRWSKSPEEKKPLYNHICNEVLSDFEHVSNTFLNTKDLHGNHDALILVKTIIKLLYSMFYSALPQKFMSVEAFEPWILIYFRSCELAIAYASLNDLNWEKLQKWSFYSIQKIFTRYGRLRSNMSKEEAKLLSKPFLDKFSAPLIHFLSAQVQAHAGGQYPLPRKSLYTLLTILTECLKVKETWTLIQPGVHQLIDVIIFPLMAVSDEDSETFMEDPTEYVNREVGFNMDFMIPSSAAEYFMSTLYLERKNAASPVVQSLIQRSIAQGNNVKVASAALHLIEVTSNSILKDKNLKKSLPQLLTQFIYPMLMSNELLLRFCAFMTLASISDSDKKENLEFVLQQQHDGWIVCFQHALEMLKPNIHLPVRVSAIVCIEKLIERDTVKQFAAEYIPFIMEHLVSISNIIDYETCTTLMERLVELFPEKVLPFSVQLAHSLEQTFLKQSAELAAMDIDSDNSDKVIAAMGILKTISTLFLTIPTNKSGEIPESSMQLLAELEIPAIKCVYEIFTKELVDLYEEGFALLDCCLFCRRQISDAAWQLFTVVEKVFSEEYADYIKELYDVVDDYIRFAPNVVAGNPRILTSVLQMASSVLHAQLPEEELIYGFKILQSVLLNCRGLLNVHCGEILAIILSSVSGSISLRFRLHCFESIMAAIVSDVNVTLEILVEKNVFEDVIANMVKLTDDLVRVYDRKLSILAICTLIKTASTEFRVAHVAPQLITALIEHLKELPKAEKAQHDLLNGEDDDEDDIDEQYDAHEQTDDEGGETGGGGGGDMSGNWEDFDETGGVGGGDDEDEFNFLLDAFDDFEDETVLDNFNVNPLVIETLSEFQHSQLSIWLGIIGTLKPEDKAVIESINSQHK